MRGVFRSCTVELRPLSESERGVLPGRDLQERASCVGGGEADECILAAQVYSDALR